MDWTDLAQDKDQCREIVNTVMDLRISWNFRRFLSGWATGGFSRRAQLHGVSLGSYIIPSVGNVKEDESGVAIWVSIECSK
jgi:hypothetical protein